MFNTGVDAAGNPLPNGATDPHWTVVAGPGVPPVTPAAVLAEQYSGTYTQSALSRWVWVNTNLPGDWTAVATNTADGAGFFEFIDADTLNFPIRFYRVRSP